MSKIVMKLPDRDEPGFLRNIRRALEFTERIQKMETRTMSVNDLDELVDFLLSFVIEPSDRQEARELLWDASEDQFYNMLKSLTMGGGDTENPTSPQRKPSDTSAGEKASGSPQPGE